MDGKQRVEGDPRLLNFVIRRFHAPGLKVKPLGEHGRALLLVRMGESPVVVKAIASEGKWKRYLWATEFLTEAGVPTPPLLLPPYSAPEESLFLIFEKYVSGKTLSSLKPDRQVLETVLRSLKRLHSLEAKRWGVPIKRMRRKGYFRRHLRKIEKWCQYDPKVWREIQQKKWVHEVVKKLEKEEKTFQMTHGDLHGKNILITENGIFFLDLVRSGFGSYAKDLARLDIWERRTWSTRTIFETYLKDLKDPLLEEKLKLFLLGEFVRRRNVDWIKECLWRLLEKEEID